METTLKKSIYILHNNAMLLKKIREITNECLSNGAYSQKNEETQLEKLNKINVPDWEKEIIIRAISFKRKLAHKTLKELDKLLEHYKGDFFNEKN